MSFVIPALNERTTLARLLGSIDVMTIPDGVEVREVIVVDAGSSDATAQIAHERGCTVLTTEPGSVSRSRNLGAANASGSVVAFVDADCELPVDWLAAIAKSIAKEDVVAAGCVMAAPARSATWVETCWYQLAHQPGSGTLLQRRWLPSFNLVVKKDEFESVGGFNELLPTCEDVDLGYRLSKLGKLERIGTSHVRHHGESRTVPDFFRRESWRARGAVVVLSLHWRDAGEFMSFFLPVLVSLAMLLGMLLVVTSVPQILSGQQAQAQILAGFGLLLLPISLLVLRRRAPAGKFAGCYLLLAVYFVARTIGMIRPFKRLERA